MNRRTWALVDFGKLAVPAIAIYAAMVLVPVGVSIYQSLTNATYPGSPTSFIGFGNFTTALESEQFRDAMAHTLAITAFVTVVPNVLGFFLALLLDRPTRLFAALRGVVFIPVVLSSVVVSFIWQVLLTQNGAVNQIVAAVGLPPVGWLQDPSVALWSIGVVLAWSLTGLCVVTYLAALQSIPLDLTEAARIDGAGQLATLRYVTWPGVAPALTLNTTVLLISGFKVYDQVLVLTGGGPAGSTETATMRILRTSLDEFRTGLSAAMAVALLITVVLLTVLSLSLLQRREVQL